LEVHDIALHPGETRRLEIGGLGSAGYAWSYEVEGPAGVIAVAIETVPPPSPPAGAPPTSYSAQHVLAVTGLEEGSATINLAQRRPWEKQKPPLREMRVQVTVTKNGGR
jgi:hypothetical protein